MKTIGQRTAIILVTALTSLGSSFIPSTHTSYQLQRRTRVEWPSSTIPPLPFIFRAHAILDENASASHIIPPRELISKLESYSSNIARTRKMMLERRRHRKDPVHIVTGVDPYHYSPQIEVKDDKNHDLPFVNAVQSLYFTLKNQQAAITMNRTMRETHKTLEISYSIRDQLAASLSATLIQAIRGSADIGDYVLILRLILDAVIPFATEFSNLYVIPPSSTLTYTPAKILQPRIFGEALVGLGQKTLCSTSKLKKLWNAFLSCSHPATTHLLLAEPSAQELTAMMTGLARRGKVRAAIQLLYSNLDSYPSNTLIHAIDKEDPDMARSTHQRIQPDAYAISEVLRILADSIQEPNTNSAHLITHLENEDSDRDVNDPDFENVIGLGSPSSPCWQWRETEAILNWIEIQHQQAIISTDNLNMDADQPQIVLNNHIYSAALKVNERAQAVYGLRKHNGTFYAHNILERMNRANISPDVITISTIMSTFDKGYKWKDAVDLLESMEKVEHTIDSVKHHVWTLPHPNVYSYSTAISSCARCGKYDQALSILERMRKGSGDTGIMPNTWVYNALLSACVRENDASTHRLKSIQLPAVDAALTILQYMEDDLLKNSDTAPDVVTYNTILALIGGMASNNKTSNDHPILSALESVDTAPRNSLTKFLIYAKDNKMVAIMSLLDEMKDMGLERNEITYRNALVASRSNPNGIAHLLRRGLMDLKMSPSSVGEDTSEAAQVVREGMANLALSLCASSSELSSTAAVFEIMQQEDIKADSNSIYHLIRALYSSRRTDESIWLLNAVKGDTVANQLFAEKTSIDVLASGIITPMIEERHYSTAIIGCLNTDEMFFAQKILSGMRIHGLVPADANLEQIILAYCKMAMDSASKEFSDARIEHLNRDKRIILKPSQHTSEARATAALNMMKTLASPTVEIRVAVARALCSSGLYSSSRQIVRSLHDSVIVEIKERTQRGIPLNIFNSELLTKLPKLHKSLLKLCARSGNITAALWYADDIQHLSSELNRGSTTMKPSIMLEDSYLSAATLPFGFSIGMNGEDWKLVTVTASKAGHWKICLQTLQFLRPYVEATNPERLIPNHPRTNSIEINTNGMLDRQYDSYARALTAAVLAFETSGQYAWAVRAINDWIEWSGRRPPKEAVFSLCRILAAKSQGVHVVALIQQILQISVPSNKTFLPNTKNKIDFDSSYEFAVYTQAIVALFQNGLYDHADELYAAAVACGCLPFALLIKEANDRFYRLDLHGMNIAIAHSAVRVSLQHLIQTSAAKPITDDLIIVTGRGHGSIRWLRPVLRPEVQRMLMEEFYPPISTVSLPGNMGALMVSAADVNEWMRYQQQQKGARLLTVAEILKSFTSGSLLTKALSRLNKDY